MKIKLNEKFKKCFIIGTALFSVATIGILGGNTYSKYFTKIEGTGSATVARWSFKANNETQTMSNIQLMADNYDDNKLTIPTIAPGTKGSFDIVLDTTGSDTAIDYEIKFNNLVNKPTNLKFFCNGKQGSSLKDLESVLTGRIELNDPRTKTIKIFWEWPYETGTGNQISVNDAQDTLDAGKNFTFDITVTGTQAHPSPLD